MLLVSYRLSGPDEDYETFFSALLEGRDFYRFSDTCYLLVSASARPLRDKLLPHLAPADRLMVTEVFKGQCAGQLPAAGREWLKRALFERPGPL